MFRDARYGIPLSSGPVSLGCRGCRYAVCDGGRCEIYEVEGCREIKLQGRYAVSNVRTKRRTTPPSRLREYRLHCIPQDPVSSGLPDEPSGKPPQVSALSDCFATSEGAFGCAQCLPQALFGCRGERAMRKAISTPGHGNHSTSAG